MYYYDLLRRQAPFALVALVCLLVILPASAARGESTERFDGRYVWTAGGSRGPLEAVFTETDSGEWEVAFHFTFDGQSHTYKGTAMGSVSDGRLEGQVRTESGRRTFTFEGEFREGSFEGTHSELRRGREQRLGSLTLSRDS